MPVDLSRHLTKLRALLPLCNIHNAYSLAIRYRPTDLVKLVIGKKLYNLLVGYADPLYIMQAGWQYLYSLDSRNCNIIYCQNTLMQLTGMLVLVLVLVLKDSN